MSHMSAPEVGRPELKLLPCGNVKKFPFLFQFCHVFDAYLVLTITDGY